MGQFNLIERTYVGTDDFLDFVTPTEVSVKLYDDEGRSESVSFYEGEPEDMTFGRNLSDAFSIYDLVLAAYQAGKEGHELVTQRVEVNEDEE